MTCPTCKHELKTNFEKRTEGVVIKCKHCGLEIGNYTKKQYNLIKSQI